MIDFRLYNAAVYRLEQQTNATNPVPWINLVIAGLRWRRLSDGTIERPTQPFMELVAAGRETSFCYDADRENWVIQLLSDDIQPGADATCCTIRCHDGWARVPSRLDLSQSRAHFWQRHCAAITADGLSSEPLRQLRMRAGVCTLLGAFISQAQPAPGDDPCERFRQAIDADDHFVHALAALAADLGIGIDHLRRQFIKRFGTTPKRYREQRRMTLAADLIANSHDNIRSIAHRLGYPHSSHFCTAYRSYFGTTPGSDLKRFRHRFLLSLPAAE